MYQIYCWCETKHIELLYSYNIYVMCYHMVDQSPVVASISSVVGHIWAILGLCHANPKWLLAVPQPVIACINSKWGKDIFASVFKASLKWHRTNTSVSLHLTWIVAATFWFTLSTMWWIMMVSASSRSSQFSGWGEASLMGTSFEQEMMIQLCGNTWQFTYICWYFQ